MNDTSLKVRILIAKPGLDGHDRGAQVIARAPRHACYGLSDTGRRQTPARERAAGRRGEAAGVGRVPHPGAHRQPRARVGAGGRRARQSSRERYPARGARTAGPHSPNEVAEIRASLTGSSPIFPPVSIGVVRKRNTAFARREARSRLSSNFPEGRRSAWP